MERSIEHFADATRDVCADVPSVKGVILFGSRARGDNRDDSDADIIVDFDGEISSKEKLQLADDLEDAYGVPISYITRPFGKLDTALKKQILLDGIVIYER